MRRLALVGALLAVAGCAASRLAPDRSDIIRRVLPSTVQLRSEREGGERRAASGVVLAADPESNRAWVVTARHFLDPPRSQRVYARRPGRDEAVQATVLAQSGEIDLAILEIHGLDLAPVPLRPVTALGDEVLILAFPWGRRLTVVSGIVSQLEPQHGRVAIEGAARMVDASVSYGSSGGGVFDASTGALIAIVEASRTARIVHPESPGRTLEVPVAGETTVVSAPAILRFLVASGLEAFLPKGARARGMTP